MSLSNKTFKPFIVPGAENNGQAKTGVFKTKRSEAEKTSPVSPTIEEAGETAFTQTEPVFDEVSFKAGKEEAAKEYEAAYASTLSALQLACEQLNQHKEDTALFFANMLAKASVTISEKILRRAVLENEEVFIKTVSDALANTIKAGEVKILVNQDDLDVSQDTLNNLFKDKSKYRIVFTGSESVTRGGCLVESEFGEVDALIETQLNEAEKILNRNINQDE